MYIYNYTHRKVQTQIIAYVKRIIRIRWPLKGNTCAKHLIVCFKTKAFVGINVFNKKLYKYLTKCG